MEILKYPNPILRQIATVVDVFDEALKKLSLDMFETMYRHGGVGLAAPQVGHGVRMIVVDVSPTRDKGFAMVNPVILNSSGKQRYEEGCLSFPGEFKTLECSEQIEVAYRDLTGESFIKTFEGIEAVVIQHECEHLDGKLFIDRMRPKDRAKVKTKFLKG